MKGAVIGFEGLYEVDDTGNVYSIIHNSSRRMTVLKTYDNGLGYKKVNLYTADGVMKKKYVHRLVAEAFIANPNQCKVVNHIDGNKANNRVENLEWCTQHENINHSWEHGLQHHYSKLTQNDVDQIRKSYIKGDREFGGVSLAKRYGVKQCTISAIVRGALWKGGDVLCQV